MSANEIHQEDIGTAFTVTIKEDAAIVDISSATVTKQIKFKKPSDTVITKNAVFVTDGTDGKMRWTTTATDDLDESGKWYLQGYIAITGFTGHSDIGDFMVYDNL